MNNAFHGKDMKAEAQKVTATGWTTNALTSADEVAPGAGQFGVIASNRFGEAPKILNARQGIQGKTGDLKKATNRAIEAKFKNMLQAFKYIDTDNSNVHRSRLEHLPLQSPIRSPLQPALRSPLQSPLQPPPGLK